MFLTVICINSIECRRPCCM